MGIGDLLFTDPSLRARQDQLDAQWQGLYEIWVNCPLIPSGTLNQFETDYTNWEAFYNSKTDWSTDAFNATNSWTTKASDWSTQLSGFGCGVTGAITADSPSGIPTVKPPPADEQSTLSSLTSSLTSGASGLWSTLGNIGWVGVGLVVLLVVGLIYTLTHAKIATPGATIG